MDADELYMQRCLELASNGLGHVSPNPLVGCVIVYQDQIIGEGYHQMIGGPHAEVNAIESVRDSSCLPYSTLYVNLEPCSHYGRTPPCADLIIRKRIKRVVIGCEDPYHEVSGQGMQRLRDHGIEVCVNVLHEQARKLNRRFFTFQEKKRPYVILKWAQTADGFIDILRQPGAEARPTWITSEKLRLLVHKWRAEESAIMIGTNTAMIDNPHLNVRDWTGKQPLRVVIDRACRLPDTLNIFMGQQETFVYNNLKDTREGHIRWVRLADSDQLLPGILTHLYQEGIQSVLVEGGRHLLQSLIDQQLCDEARVFVGPQFFGNGCRAPVTGMSDPSQIILGNENFFWFRF